MPFIRLNTNFSKLASYYNAPATNAGTFGNVNNVTYTQKPTIPKTSDQYNTSDAGIIRGGFENVALSIKKDFNTFTDFFYRKEKGTTFLLKQVGLYLSNPLLEQRVRIKNKYSKPVTTAVFQTNTYENIDGDKFDDVKLVGYETTQNFLGKKKSSNPIGSTRIYGGGVNTLASISGTALGFHYPSFGFTPLSDYDYAKIARDNNARSVDTGVEVITPISPTVVSLDKASVKNTPQSKNFNPQGNDLKEVVTTGTRKKKLIESPYSLAPNRLLTYLGRMTENGDSVNPVTLQSYFGGAGSLYGIGRTRIRTTGDSVTNKSDNSYNKDRINNFLPLSYKSIQVIGDRLKEASPNLSAINSYLTDSSGVVSSKNLEKTYLPLEYNYGISTNKGDAASSVDAINSISITDSVTFYQNVQRTMADIGNLPQGVSPSSTYGKDIIKFRIEILNNNKISVNDSDGVKIPNTEVYAFRAYLNELSDGIDAKWDAYRYMGRGEEFYIYNGFTRDVNVGFTVFAHSQPEMKHIYQKVNNLMSSFAPDYSTAGLMRGNIGYLTVGDYLYRVPGVFTSMKITNLLETHWEINLDGGEYELPKLMNINMAFKPIHSFVPRRNYADKERAAFITPDVVTYASDPGVGNVGKEGSNVDVVNKYMPYINKRLSNK
jgi:hypothetical protein